MLELPKRCTKCILPEDYPGIRFNSEGICNFCIENKRHNNKCLGAEKLIDLINSQKSDSNYDCVVPLSGGKDSTYILYYIARKLKMNPIAVNYNSGFQSEIARENIENACKELGVKLLVRTSKENIQKMLIKQALLISEITGAFVSRTCGNCEVLLRSIPLNVAREYKIPFILWGSSPQEGVDDSLYAEYRFGTGRASLQQRFTAVITKISRLKLEPQQMLKLVIPMIKYNLLSRYQRLQMGVPLKYAIRPTAVTPFSIKDVKYVHFFDYIGWNSMKDISVLKNYLKWRHPENQESRFDCALHCFGNYRYLQEKGITSDGVNFCNFIREGKATRKWALKREENLRKTIEKECEKIICEECNIKKFKMPLLRQIS